MLVYVQGHAPAALYQEIIRRFHWTEGWMGPRTIADMDAE
jgi:hypothetical protein